MGTTTSTIGKGFIAASSTTTSNDESYYLSMYNILQRIHETYPTYYPYKNRYTYCDALIASTATTTTTTTDESNHRSSETVKTTTTDEKKHPTFTATTTTTTTAIRKTSNIQRQVNIVSLFLFCFIFNKRCSCQIIYMFTCLYIL
jgi:hypothetical protein